MLTKNDDEAGGVRRTVPKMAKVYVDQNYVAVQLERDWSKLRTVYQQEMPSVRWLS